MRILIDTHILLWWMMNDSKLSARAADLIKSRETVVFLSTVSIWELRIKESLGKIKLPVTFADDLKQERFEMLSIHPEHAHSVSTLPMHHRDPFDRLLIAQAITEDLTLVTHDNAFAQYGVSCLLV
jgi:PIN domain nuclease of toxin-antitoxin system